MNTIHDAGSLEAPGAADLGKIDLNLLVAFDALARERHVTRAAERLHVTQSAMSHALGRLRELLGDQLLVRGRGGMVLTPRAEELRVPVRSGLTTLGRALAQPRGFDAATARRAFRLASPDLFDVLVVPPLLERVRREAPGVDVAVTPVDERALGERLEAGEVDAGVVPQLEGVKLELPQAPTQGLLRSRLFRDRFVCLLRADHPCLASARGRRAAPRLSLETFAALSHALVSPTGEGRGFVDQLLEARGLTRRVALRVPHFYSALAIVEKSDLVVTAPSALSLLIAPGQRVVALRVPLPVPEHSVNLVWHERFSKDPGHAWLRGVVAGVCRELGGRAGMTGLPARRKLR